MSSVLLIERYGRVALVRIHRPQALNALNSEVMQAFATQLPALDRDPEVGCIVVTGNERAFAAGADIKELARLDYLQMHQSDYFCAWQAFANVRTPRIAAVHGYALGGGCELAMMCDTIYAADNAQFGQPEVKIGCIPGMGGSQRLTKLVGRAVAMDMVLTGRMMDAQEALRAGLVARVFTPDALLDETLAVAHSIASYSKHVTTLARESVARAEESGLHEGLLFERRIYHALFGTPDQQEGMAAFMEKRAPVFHR